MPSLPPHVSRGDPITAAEWNAMRDFVRAMSNIKTSGGLSATFTQSGLVLALTALTTDYIQFGKITVAPAPGVVVLPSACRYSAVAMGKEWTVNNALPVYGRRVFGDECGLYPAVVGDYCAIMRNTRVNGADPIAELFVLTEKEARIPC